MLCFDLGAHLGNRTRAFRDLGARVVAVEPQPVCVQFLQKKFQSDPQVQIVPRAVSDTNGTLELKMSRRYPTISTAAGRQWQETVQHAAQYPIAWEDTVTVECVTLDALIADHGLPDFCKIDVEGFEEHVLRGLSQAIPALSFEFFREMDSITQACIEHLEQFGTYRYNWSRGESQRMELDVWVAAPALLRFLRQLPPGHLSGDIYAVLI